MERDLNTSNSLGDDGTGVQPSDQSSLASHSVAAITTDNTPIEQLKTLHLTLHRKAFEVMVTGEKNIEFRANNTWIKSRLLNKGGTVKKYQAIKFVNGYGSDKPYFICEYRGYGWISGVFQYSNGLEVLADNCIGIRCGRILQVGNWLTKEPNDKPSVASKDPQ